MLHRKTLGLLKRWVIVATTSSDSPNSTKLCATLNQIFANIACSTPEVSFPLFFSL